eukprot:c19667_g1_i4.p1 GENE.c19667_g1_i4~~c19667_g1_i4.p1  ORF type:complete len:761 (+),score=243.88 c19667_g1_i4:51-2285(+)
MKRTREEDEEGGGTGGANGAGGQELTLSIEETNKLRAQLGLKPLGEKNKDNKTTEVIVLVDDRKEKEIAKVEERVERARRKRKLNEKLSGKGLGESDPEDAVDDVRKWVEKSRTLEKKKAIDLASMFDEVDADAQQAAKQYALPPRPAPKQQEYSSTDLEGLRIVHQADSFQTGADVILTLKDNNVLDEEDQLENIHISEKDRRERAVAASKKLSASEILEKGEAGVLLPKYDEVKEAEGITLGSEGMIDLEKTRRIEAIRAKLQNPQRQEISLDVPKDIVASDYYTAEEMAQFKTKKTKKKKFRSKEKLEELLAGEEDTAQDHGSRRERGGAEAQRRQEEGEKRKRFERALSQANEKSKALKEGSQTADKDSSNNNNNTSKANKSEAMDQGEDGAVKETQTDKLSKGTGKPRNKILIDEPMLDSDAENEAALLAIENDRRELDETLQRALKVTTRQARTEEQVLALLQMAKDAEREVTLEGGDRIDLSETQEFCRNIQAATLSRPETTKRTNDRNGNDTKAGTESTRKSQTENDAVKREVAEHNTTTTSYARGFTEVEEGVKSSNDKDVVMGEEESEGEERVNVLDDEPIVNGGLAATLRYATRKNYLVKEREAGRNNDPRNVDAAVQDPSVTKEDLDSIVLTYKDEFGREMTKKEAFRALSHRFHGRGPGKKKKEQRLLRYYEELDHNRRQANPTESSSFMKALNAHQQRSGQAFVVVQGSQTISQLKAPESLSKRRPPVQK